MSEDVIQRRAASPALIAIRKERQLLLPVRRQIGELQKRAAFLEARAKSTRPISTEEKAAEVGDIRHAIAAGLDTIDDLMQGALGVGPAADCRRALAYIEERLRSL